MKLIDKDALVAEIERRKEEEVNYDENGGYASWADHNHFSTLDSIQDFVNTLEVKEVDLEDALLNLDREIKEFVTTDEFENDSATAGHYWAIAKHAFLLGIKVQKGK